MLTIFRQIVTFKSIFKIKISNIDLNVHFLQFVFIVNGLILRANSQLFQDILNFILIQVCQFKLISQFWKMYFNSVSIAAHFKYPMHFYNF
jgi:hypothetical protein